MIPSLRDRLGSSLGLLYRRWATARARDGVGAVLRAARATMLRKRYCLLVTLADGVAHARVLEPFPPDDDFTVWLGTSRGSRKVEQLRKDPAATLAYQDDARGACAVLVGRAEIVEGVSERRRRFKPFWRAFWPEGPDGAEFVLVRFRPERIEVWDGWRGVTPAPFGQRSAMIARAPDGAWRSA
ncbi:pyridoxamine 5'-phosphate oxidase-related FMN-binding [Anaeromyxobacter sp. K]|uniref:pyridoxamine 5'-phosphate oxidase family protein n=1 Tax=Anaeromyxobacter sp. (strain K) TaxID=447217 RepID=UPI00015F9406|nr:pyridoxamine 5'-phosphate oxidase family protein [Anaeromyxobacter sp. K]ACG75085.1 pyridoxamine 5'-phosphate oxidase-related FMN-binding [Anaeromyxobacter sp. K]